MPCRDERGEPHYLFRDEVQKNRALHAKVDRLTALLCHACNHLEQMGGEINAELHLWYEAHKRADKYRQEQEALEAKRKAQHAAARDAAKQEQARLKAIRERVVSQLTADERLALGIK